MTLRITLIILVFLFPMLAKAENGFPGYEWRALGNGVFVHMREDPFAGPIDGNSTVIINDEDVFVVDTHINPAAARAVIEKIKSLTQKPVTHVINTHWHDDHVNGNQAFIDAFPDVKILSHPDTLSQLQEEWPGFIENRQNGFAEASPERIQEAADTAEAEYPDKAITYRVYAGYVEALKPELHNLATAYPNETIAEQKIFIRSKRKIIVEWVGPGNTPGDLVVWLPEEKILITGDIVAAPIPYAFDAPMLEWPETLQKLAGFEAERIVPGHGQPQKDTDYLFQVASLIRETVSQVEKAAESGVAYENLREVVDLEAQKDMFTKGDPWAVNAWTNYYFVPALQSAWSALGYPIPEDEAQ